MCCNELLLGFLQQSLKNKLHHIVFSHIFLKGTLFGYTCLIRGEFSIPFFPAWPAYEYHWWQQATLPSHIKTPSLPFSAEPLSRSTLLPSPFSWALESLEACSWPADLWQALFGVSAPQLATAASLATQGLLNLARWRLGWDPAG